MVNKFVSIVIFGAVMLLCTTAFAEQGSYFAAKVGAGWVDDMSESESSVKMDLKLDSAVSLAASIGYDFSPIRIEGELAWQKNNFDELNASSGGYKFDLDVDGDISSYILLANAYYDIRNHTPISLIIGVGIGGAYLETNDVEIEGFSAGDDDDFVFAYQLTAGLGYELSAKTTVEITYRYLDTSNNDFDLDYSSQNVYAGLRYKF